MNPLILALREALAPQRCADRGQQRNILVPQPTPRGCEPCS